MACTKCAGPLPQSGRTVWRKEFRGEYLPYCSQFCAPPLEKMRWHWFGPKAPTVDERLSAELDQACLDAIGKDRG